MLRVLALTLLLTLSSPAWCFYFVRDNVDIIENAANAAHTLDNYYQNVSEVADDLEVVHNQYTMLKSLNVKNISSAMKGLHDVSNIASAGGALTYSSANLSSQFNKDFGNGKKGKKNKHPNFASRINAQMQTVLATTQGTLKAAHQQMQYNIEEGQGLSDITHASDSASGTKAVLQGTTELLDATAAQQQRMLQMQAQQNSLEATIAAQKASQEQAAAREDQYFLNYTPNYNEKYQPDNNLKQIPDF